MPSVLRKKAMAIEEDRKVDLYYYFGQIQRPHDDGVIRTCLDRCIGGQSSRKKRRERAMLILATIGGSADAAYRIARCFQQRYKGFICYVPRLCKSAGTLLAVGSHQLVMSEFSELGPLDVQIYKKDELGELSSGLDLAHALNDLNYRAIRTLEETFLQLKSGSGGLITLKTALETATQVTTGLFAPVFAQINPVVVGENGRAMLIAQEYGERLVNRSESLVPGGLQRLVAHFPSHGFVIDKSEAESLFRHVNSPTADEETIGDFLCEVFSAFSEEPNYGFVSSVLELLESKAGARDGKGDGDDGKSSDAKRRPGRETKATGKADSNPRSKRKKTA